MVFEFTLTVWLSSNVFSLCSDVGCCEGVVTAGIVESCAQTACEAFSPSFVQRSLALKFRPNSCSELFSQSFCIRDF